MFKITRKCGNEVELKSNYDEETVVITKKEYERLLNNSRKLEASEGTQCGSDSYWSRYG